MGDMKIKSQYFFVFSAYHVWSHSAGILDVNKPPTHGVNILLHTKKKTGSVMIYKIYAISDMKNK